MPVNLFEKLPQIWKRLDISVTDIIDNKGFLERYLIAPDAKFNSFEDLIREYLRSQNVEFLRDAFLPLLNGISGHRWKDNKTRVWNRNRLQVAITRASYKGRWLAIEDLAREHGAATCKIIDMASLVGVYDRQAAMPQNSHYFDSDYFHPGVFQLWLPDTVNMAEFLEDFEYLKPAGTRWIIKLWPCDYHTAIEVLDFGYPITIYGGKYDYTYKLYNQSFGFYDHIPQVAWEPTQLSTYWVTLSNPDPQIYGSSFYITKPQYPVDPVIWQTYWVPIDFGNVPVYGNAFYGDLSQLPIAPTISISDNYQGVANAYLDMRSLSFNWADQEITFEEDIIPEEMNWRQPLVEPIILT